MAKKRIKFLRTNDLSSVSDNPALNFVPADGQPFYDVKSNMLFIGDGTSKVSDIKAHYEKTLNSNGAQKLINVDASTGNITNQSTTEGKLMYVDSNGKVKNYNASNESNKNIGSGINPVYIANDGTVTASSSTVGTGGNKIVYLKDGTMTESAANVGGTTTSGNTTTTYPVYLNAGVITKLIDALSNDITGNAATVTNGVYTEGNQTINGTKTFSTTISGSVSGNAGTVTNGVYTTGNQTINGTKTFTDIIAGSISGTATNISISVQKNYEFAYKFHGSKMAISNIKTVVEQYYDLTNTSNWSTIDNTWDVITIGNHLRLAYTQLNIPSGCGDGYWLAWRCTDPLKTTLEGYTALCAQAIPLTNSETSTAGTGSGWAPVVHLTGTKGTILQPNGREYIYIKKFTGDTVNMGVFVVFYKE